MRGTATLAALLGVLAQGGYARHGCPGRLTGGDAASGDFGFVDWSGPASRVFGWTQGDFIDAKMLSWTRRRGAL